VSDLKIPEARRTCAHCESENCDCLNQHIPEDLRETYSNFKSPYRCGLDNELVVKLIERIAQQDAEIERLKAERDEFERKGKELCSAYGNSLITIHDLNGLLRELKEFYCNNECERWPEHQELCKRTDQQLQKTVKQIAELEEEIRWMESLEVVATTNAGEYCRQRIVDRLKAALTELQTRQTQGGESK